MNPVDRRLPDTRRSTRARRRAWGALLLVLATAVATEGASRAALTSRAFRDRIRNAGSEGRRLVALLDWHARPEGVADAAGARRLQHDPELGWTPRPGVHTIGGADATVDAQGHRRTPTAFAGAPHMALVGDSFTFGEEVADTETFAWALATRTGWRVVDHGVPSHGLDQAVLRLERDVLRTQPDLVILGVNTPMHHRTVVWWDAWAKPWFTLTDGQLELHGSPVPPPEVVARGLGWSRAAALVVVGIDAWTSPLHDAVEVEQRSRALMQRAVQDCRAAGVPLWLVWLPEPGLAPSVAERPRAGTSEAYRGLCDDGVRCVDLWPAFVEAWREGVQLERGAHWSPQGHALVAEVLAGALATP